MFDNLKYNEDIFRMVGFILESVDLNEMTIYIDDLTITMGTDDWENHTAYTLEVSHKNNDRYYKVSVGKYTDDTSKEIYPNGCYLHFDSDGFYELTEKLKYEDGDDDKLIYEHLKKYSRNINIENLLEDETY